MGFALSGVPILATLLSSSAVRDAPPFNDRAFHRTLPPCDGVAFRSVLAIHLLVLAGISAATAVYCAHLNFGWEAFRESILRFVGPLGIFMIFFGIGASMATSPGRGKMLGFAVIFGAPLLSFWFPWLVLLGWTPGESEGASMPAFLLLVAIVYFLIWWLVAVRRRKALGMVLGGIFGLWLPWIPWILAEVGLRGRAAPPGIVATAPASEPVKWHRKNSSVEPSEWFPVSQVLGVTGLERGEIARMKIYSIGRSNQEAWVSEVGSETRWAQRGTLDASLAKDGSLRWGRTALLDLLRGQLPPLGNLSYLSGEDSIQGSSVLSFYRPDDDLIAPGRRLSLGYTMDEFMSERWSVSMQTFRYDLAGSVDLSRGGSFRVSSGGRIFVDPVVKGQITQDSVAIRYCFPGRDESRIWGYQQTEIPGPVLVIADGSGKQAYVAELAVDPQADPHLWLGNASRWLFRFKNKNVALLESLKGGRVHVFLPTVISSLRPETLPPHPEAPR